MRTGGLTGLLRRRYNMSVNAVLTGFFFFLFNKSHEMAIAEVKVSVWCMIIIFKRRRGRRARDIIIIIIICALGRAGRPRAAVDALHAVLQCITRM